MGSHETGEIFDRAEDSPSRLHEEKALKRDVLRCTKIAKPQMRGQFSESAPKYTLLQVGRKSDLE